MSALHASERELVGWINKQPYLDGEPSLNCTIVNNGDNLKNGVVLCELVEILGEIPSPPLPKRIIDIDGVQKRISNKQSVGIIRDSHDIPVGKGPWDQQNKMHVAYYYGINGGGQVYHKDENIKGVVEFQNNQILRQELDFNQGTLIFFVDGIQQPVYISGINEKVRFFIQMYHENASCIILSLKQLANPTQVHIANKKVIQW
ncbi:MAG: hypothetical protein EZS28_006126 [Streblomastix strix]|uniref:Uncharacterized protein n=1 Tax=Streblomastix strix TaxID=222440 RepID=A0A5J4WTP2_9EUKA|nr:MAG: hypothetical protein EZS28_006126 [Streblomastix strix]